MSLLAWLLAGLLGMLGAVVLMLFMTAAAGIGSLIRRHRNAAAAIREAEQVVRDYEMRAEK